LASPFGAAWGQLRTGRRGARGRAGQQRGDDSRRDLAELIAGVGQDAGRCDLVGLVEEEVALDRDVKWLERATFAKLWRDDGQIVRLTASELALFVEGCTLVSKHAVTGH
jgi:hypothetical protein